METDKQYRAWWQRRRSGEQTPDPAPELHRELDRLWEISGRYGDDYTPDVEAGLERFRSRLHQTPRSGATDRRRALRPAAPYGRMAAAVLLIVAAVGIVYIALGGRTSSGETVEWVVVRTQAGESREVILDDGTTVLLNAGSELSFPRRFQGEHRQVAFSGEGYFHIRHQPDQPFIVKTPTAEVRVLGTRFNLRAYPAENFTEVEVEEGRVALRPLPGGEAVVLQEREYVLYRHDDNQTLRKQDSPGLIRQAWRTGTLSFRGMTLPELAPLLARFYDVRIEIDPAEGENCILSGNYNITDWSDMEQVLNLHKITVKSLGANAYRLRCGS